METVAYCQHLLGVQLYRCSSTLANRSNHHRQRRRKLNAALSDFGFAMRDLTLRRITANRVIINLRSHHHRHTNTTTMSKSGDESLAPKVEAEKKQPEEAPPLPPPPEKPLPGDCCGSGCVRCVWDIYYEELEDYNSLCKSNSDSKSNSKPS
ncbi:uncharacterized protein LOC132284457 [Cornus florida]|uniref:uncharacterized protein LOC132284457 n=1 Tax=Cornus florida TaxID=4283 RepID=UPI0028A09D70|nr:uncharacterized protein LOC132284457 [Cornus florida]